MSRNNLGPDPSGWSNGQMTSFAGTVAGGLAMAVTASLVRAAAANKRPVRVLSAQEAYDAEVDFLRTDLELMGYRLQYSQRETAEARKRVAELEAEAVEREYRARY